MAFKEIVYKIVSRVPRGKVLTYGQVARISGLKSPRVVGNILHKNTDPENIPCHRVVNSKGEVADNFVFGGAKGQIEKLVREGITIDNGRVDLDRYIWEPD